MRSIINISVPQQIKKEVDQAVKQGNYASTSEFFRDILRTWKEQRLVKELRQSQREIKQGKGKVLHSLRDLR